MSGHDQTGLLGYGPKTGRCVEFPAGDPLPDEGRHMTASGFGPGFNRSGGFGGGRGRGNRARRGWNNKIPIDPQDERKYAG